MEKEKEKKKDALKFIGGREQPLLWGICEVFQDIAAFAKMAFEDGKCFEKLKWRVVVKAGNPGRENRMGKCPGVGDCGPHTKPQKYSPWLKPKRNEEESGN